MRELDALRWAGRARRVDQRQDVVLLDGAPHCVEVEAAVTPGFEIGERDRALDLTVNHDHVFDQRCVCRADDVEELALADDDSVVSVREQVADLVGYSGVVDDKSVHPEVADARTRLVKARVNLERDAHKLDEELRATVLHYVEADENLARALFDHVGGYEPSGTEREDCIRAYSDALSRVSKAISALDSPMH